MNPDPPLTPREELEARLTALLLGELSAEDAAAVCRAIEQDAFLAQLHERLKATIALVREAAASASAPAAAQAAPLKLSEERRQKLLAHFKTVRPKEFARRVGARCRGLSRWPPRRRWHCCLRPGQFWSGAGDEALMCLETFWRNRRWHWLFPHSTHGNPSKN